MVRFIASRLASWSTAALLAALIAFLPGQPALARVDAHVDLTHQRMVVTVNGRHYASWAISSGRKGYRTPTGNYRPTALKRMHYSSKYDDAPMPYSIFFHKGYAIHGTDKPHYLGRPASHGCVRLHPRHAAELYSLVKQFGRSRTRIHVSY